MRRAHAAPREVTADRWLLIALILGPILLVVGLTASGALDAAEGLRDTLAAAGDAATGEAGEGCAPPCLGALAAAD